MKQTAMLFMAEATRPSIMPDDYLTVYNAAVRAKARKRQAEKLWEFQNRQIRRHRMEEARKRRRARIRMTIIVILIGIASAEGGAVAALMWALAR